MTTESHGTPSDERAEVSELLPCPFCGSADIDPEGWATKGGIMGPACNACQASVGSALLSTEENIAAWNRRALASRAHGDEPALFVSPGQLADHSDPMDDGYHGGCYIPARKTMGGKFTQPLYTRPSDACGECATEGCSSHGTVRLEAGQIGSLYCADCTAKVLALRALSLTGSGRGVKALEWHGPDVDDTYYAHAICGSYTIGQETGNGRWLGGVGGYFTTVDAAKAAANNLHEKIILSAISPEPTLKQTGSVVAKPFLYAARYVATGEPWLDEDCVSADADYIADRIEDDEGILEVVALYASEPITAREVTDEMVEAAAEVLWDDNYVRHSGPWKAQKPDRVLAIQVRATARAALLASLNTSGDK